MPERAWKLVSVELRKPADRNEFSDYEMGIPRDIVRGIVFGEIGGHRFWCEQWITTEVVDTVGDERARAMLVESAVVPQTPYDESPDFID